MKDSLRKTLKHARLTFEELSTALVEIENIMNSRPLTYMSDDAIEAITPFHLLHGRNISVRGGSVIMRERFKDSNNMYIRVKHIQYLINQYWRRFYNEYILALRERMLYDKTKRITKELQLDDIVFIADDKSKPTYWKKGRIIELIKGRDSVIRGVKLQSTTPTGNITRISRPVQKVIPMEIRNTSYDDNLQKNSSATKDDSNADENVISSNAIDIDLNTDEVNTIIDDSNTNFDNSNIHVHNANDSNTNTGGLNAENMESNNNMNYSNVRPRRKAAIVGEKNRRFQM